MILWALRVLQQISATSAVLLRSGFETVLGKQWQETSASLLFLAGSRFAAFFFTEFSGRNQQTKAGYKHALETIAMRGSDLACHPLKKLKLQFMLCCLFPHGKEKSSLAKAKDSIYKTLTESSFLILAICQAKGTGEMHILYMMVLSCN